MSSEHHIDVRQERHFSSGVLSVTTTYRLLITGDRDLRELDRLIRILTLQKQILEEEETGMTSPEKIQALRTALTHCLGLLCESGDLNNYRNLSDTELGKAWTETAKEAASILDATA